jgi:hypothetical protein
MSIENAAGSEYTLPSNPADRKKIKGNIEDIVDILLQIEAFKSTIKEKTASMKEELGVPPKFAMKLAKILYKEQTKGGELEAVVAEAESLEAGFELLFRGGNPADFGLDDEGDDE